VVYHQAAQAGVRESVEEPKTVNRYNVDGTVEILEAARSHDVERVVVASSSSVYRLRAADAAEHGDHELRLAMSPRRTTGHLRLG
jgi:nucleoside-diphosphate-sugar epimerase